MYVAIAAPLQHSARIAVLLRSKLTAHAEDCPGMLFGLVPQLLVLAMMEMVLDVVRTGGLLSRLQDVVESKVDGKVSWCWVWIGAVKRCKIALS